MPRLPGVDQYECTPEVVQRYIDACLEYKGQVKEKQDAAKLPVKLLNGHRKQYTKAHSLYTPGVDLAIKLFSEFKSRSRREFLRAFDMAREVLDLDNLPDDEQLDMLDQEERGANDLAQPAV